MYKDKKTEKMSDYGKVNQVVVRDTSDIKNLSVAQVKLISGNSALKVKLK